MDTKTDENRGKELNNKINEFFTNVPPKTLKSMQYNDLLSYNLEEHFRIS